MKATVLLTGATGFVGGNLLLRLATDHSVGKVLAVVRSDSALRGYDRLFRHLKRLSDPAAVERTLHKTEIICGDLTVPRLGLGSPAYDRMASRLTHIVHCAASVSFIQSVEEIRKINIGGTEEMIRLAQAVNKKGKLRRFGYVGTAYVSGNRTGTIYEDEFREPASFANSYEETKFEAEMMVRSIIGEMPVTIFRPSIIVGDSRKGTVTSPNGMYILLRLILREAIRILPGSDKTRLDIVPVDYVCDAMHYLLFHQSDPSGTVYHLTSGNEAVRISKILKTAETSIEDSQKSSRFAKVKFLPLWIFNIVKHLFFGRKKQFLNYASTYAPYLVNQRVFDNSVTKRALKNTTISLPEYHSYCQPLFSYWFRHSL